MAFPGTVKWHMNRLAKRYIYIDRLIKSVKILGQRDQERAIEPLKYLMINGGNDVCFGEHSLTLNKREKYLELFEAIEHSLARLGVNDTDILLLCLEAIKKLRIADTGYGYFIIRLGNSNDRIALSSIINFIDSVPDDKYLDLERYRLILHEDEIHNALLQLGATNDQLLLLYRKLLIFYDSFYGIQKVLERIAALKYAPAAKVLLETLQVWSRDQRHSDRVLQILSDIHATSHQMAYAYSRLASPNYFEALLETLGQDVREKESFPKGDVLKQKWQLLECMKRSLTLPEIDEPIENYRPLVSQLKVCLRFADELEQIQAHDRAVLASGLAAVGREINSAEELESNLKVLIRIWILLEDKGADLWSNLGDYARTAITLCRTRKCDFDCVYIPKLTEYRDVDVYGPYGEYWYTEKREYDITKKRFRVVDVGEVYAPYIRMADTRPKELAQGFFDDVGFWDLVTDVISSQRIRLWTLSEILDALRRRSWMWYKHKTDEHFTESLKVKLSNVQQKMGVIWNQLFDRNMSTARNYPVMVCLLVGHPVNFCADIVTVLGHIPFFLTFRTIVGRLLYAEDR